MIDGNSHCSAFGTAAYPAMSSGAIVLSYEFSAEIPLSIEK